MFICYHPGMGVLNLSALQEWWPYFNVRLTVYHHGMSPAFTCMGAVFYLGDTSTEKMQHTASWAAMCIANENYFILVLLMQHLPRGKVIHA
jgi:hypothetical protein